MVARVTRITILALVAATVIALSGFPAQAQPYYYNNYNNYNYGPQPYYGATCQTYSYGGMMYTNCPQPQPYTYYNSPYYAPYSTYYYYYGPSRSAGSHER